MLELILIDENTTKREMKEFYQTAKELGENAIIDKLDAKELLETKDILEYIATLNNDRGDDVISFYYYNKRYNIIIKKLSSNEYELECFKF